MDVLSFIAALVGSLAWPAALVVFFFVFRRALIRLIPGLLRVKYKDFELEFGRQLAEVKEELGPAGMPQAVLPEPEGRRQLSTLSRESAIRYFRSLAEVSPRAAILETWLGFELAANGAVESLGLAPSGRPISMQQLLSTLREAELINGSELEALTRLRALRNQVVHGPEPDLSTDLIAEYASVLKRITDDMQTRLISRRENRK